MFQYAIKLAITAATVVIISEVAKRSSVLGAIIASLPLTSLLAILWLYGETGDTARIADLARGIFWYVLPSLVLFIVLPLMLTQGFNFWLSFTVSIALTFAAYLAMTRVLAHYGITL